MAAERSRLSVLQMVEAIYSKIGAQEIALSAIGYSELLLGLERDLDLTRRTARERFFADLLRVAAVHPYDIRTARLAGRLGGQQAARGLTIPFTDLMIGVTAISLGFAVVTSNERHFRMIPGLDVIVL